MKDYEVVIGLEVHVELQRLRYSVAAQQHLVEHLIHTHALFVQVCQALFQFLTRR